MGPTLGAAATAWSPTVTGGKASVMSAWSARSCPEVALTPNTTVPFPVIAGLVTAVPPLVYAHRNLVTSTGTALVASFPARSTARTVTLTGCAK